MTAHERLRKWISDAGLTQAQVADLTGLHQATISQVLGGRRSAGLHAAHAIERATAAWEHGPIRTEEWDETLHELSVADGVSSRECQR